MRFSTFIIFGAALITTGCASPFYMGQQSSTQSRVTSSHMSEEHRDSIKSVLIRPSDREPVVHVDGGRRRHRRGAARPLGALSPLAVALAGAAPHVPRPVLVAVLGGGVAVTAGHPARAAPAHVFLLGDVVEMSWAHAQRVVAQVV